MSKDVNYLLKSLEPEIDKKCTEFKSKKSFKVKQVIYILLLIMFVTIPSLLVVFNISIIYFIIGLVLFVLVMTFMKLPDLLNSNVKGVCYE